MVRRGLGKGRGKGYKNLTGKDPRVHSESARGIKTVQKLPLITNNLPLQFGIIVPSTDRDKPISRSRFNKRINDEKEWFSKQFGGDTSVESVGSYWDDEKKKLIKEPGAIVWSSMSKKKYNEKVKMLSDRIKENKEKWQQQSVLFKIEGYDFIYPKQDFIDHDSDIKAVPVT